MTKKIYSELEAENHRQLLQWGIQNHSISDWLMIIGEEFGEACQSGVEVKFSSNEVKRRERLEELRAELVQLSAVTAAMIDSLDRNELCKDYR